MGQCGAGTALQPPNSKHTHMHAQTHLVLKLFKATFAWPAAGPSHTRVTDTPPNGSPGLTPMPAADIPVSYHWLLFYDIEHPSGFMHPCLSNRACRRQKGHKDVRRKPRHILSEGIYAPRGLPSGTSLAGAVSGHHERVGLLIMFSGTA
jgi:hypothetical protein